MNKLAQKYLRPSQIPTKACHGCGIGMIENWLLQAIDELGLEQDDVILGTGIGCVGRQTYATWAGDNLGATHGRVLAVATGLKIAQPDKKILIVVGDGDAASIGTSHLLHPLLPLLLFPILQIIRTRFSHNIAKWIAHRKVPPKTAEPADDALVSYRRK